VFPLDGVESIASDRFWLSLESIALRSPPRRRRSPAAVRCIWLTGVHSSVSLVNNRPYNCDQNENHDHETNESQHVNPPSRGQGSGDVSYDGWGVPRDLPISLRERRVCGSR
jgi:hypothetical protein